MGRLGAHDRGKFGCFFPNPQPPPAARKDEATLDLDARTLLAGGSTDRVTKLMIKEQCEEVMKAKKKASQPKAKAKAGARGP